MLRLVLLLAVIATNAVAQEFKPYPTAHITVEQWQMYFEEVSRKHASTQKESPLEPLLVFSNGESRTLYAFTKPGHPAHPAIVNRRIVERGQGVDLDQIGYFAGDEAAFVKLYRAFEQSNVQVREYMRRQAEGKK